MDIKSKLICRGLQKHEIFTGGTLGYLEQLSC
jgi:hypothetical protein